MTHLLLEAPALESPTIVLVLFFRFSLVVTLLCRIREELPSWSTSTELLAGEQLLVHRGLEAFPVEFGTAIIILLLEVSLV